MILQKYEEASGQKINLQKSAITFSAKTPLEIKIRVKDELKIQNEGGKGKYLGLPELFGRKKKDLFTSIIDRIKQKALSWSSRFLSSAGKLIMLKSVLSVMPTYTMTCFKIPKSLCKRIQSALTRFWWDANTEKKKMCWISWKKMSKSIKSGGLGFKDIQKFNADPLAKVSWRLLTKPACLLGRVLLGKYCQSAHFLDSKVPNSASHEWRSICIGRDLLKPNLGKLVGNGLNTPMWKEPWLSTAKPFTPTGPATEETQHLTVSHLFHPETCEWNREIIQDILPEYAKDILTLRPSKRGGLDRWAWLPIESGVYSTKSGYYEAMNDEEIENSGSIPLDDYNWKSKLWGLKASRKSICKFPGRI